jgi:molecular chaperone DnaK
VPQVEVTFEIDANGILNVSAKDRDTGAEQSITISDTTNLDKSEVERMIQDADRYRDEDQRLRQLVDARNELDAAAHQVERRLAELGEAVPLHEKARAEQLVADARQAVKGESTELDRMRSLTSELQQVYHGLASARPTESSVGGGSEAPPGGGGQRADDDDVIDADFTVS